MIIKRRIMFSLMLVISLAAFCASGIDYNAVTNGLWHVSATWDPAGVPTEADSVIVSNYTVILNQNAHAERLSVNGGTLNANNLILLMDSDTDLYGGGYLRDGIFNLATLNLSNGTVENNEMSISVFNWTGGRINNSYLTVVDGLFNPAGPLYLDNSQMQVTGTFRQGNTGIIRLDGTGSIITNAGTWQLTNDSQPFEYTGSFVNEGTFQKNGGTGTSDINVDFSDLAGRVQVDSGQLRFNGSDKDYFFSNTTFAVASGSSVYLPYGAVFSGDINGSGTGSLILNGDLDFTNSCVFNAGFGNLLWNGGRFLGDVTTRSLVEVASSAAKTLLNTTWTIEGGVSHTSSSGAFYLNRSKIVVPANSTYNLKTDGERISNVAYGRINLDGTFAKTGGGGTTTIDVPVYGDGAMINVSTGTLALTGSGRLDNLTVTMANNNILSLTGVCSNFIVSSVDNGKINFSQSDSTAAGLWSLTNTTFQVAGEKLYVTPAMTMEGTNSTFSFSGGHINDGVITNKLPFELTAGSAKYMVGCNFHSFADADFNYAGMIFQNSTWHNYPGIEHRVNVDGKIFDAPSGSTYYNEGTLRKTAGGGESGSSIKFIDTAGTLIVDAGTLWISSADNQFYNTQVQLAAGTAFRMSGSVCSNMTISAAGQATVQLASDGYDQTINTDLAITGPVTVKLSSDDLTMTGAITGAEASFTWNSGRIINSKLTNAVPCLFTGTATRTMSDSQVYIEKGAIQTNAIIYLSHTAIYNQSNSVYQIASDGDILRNSSYGYFRNRGTFIKTGGSGTTDIKAIFQNQGGIIGAECGLFRFSAALDFTNGEAKVDLGGVSDYGRIQSTASVSANGGTLTVELRDGYEPAVGDSFTILSGSSLTGEFAATNLPALTGGHFWNTRYTGSSVILTVASPEDTDGDLLLDSWEIDKFGSITNSNGGDENHDADIVTDYYEYIADTDPLDSNSYFCITTISNSTSAAISFYSSSNRIYSLFGSSDLSSNTWSAVSGAGPRAGVGGADILQDTNEPPQGPYYRLKVQLP